MRGMDINMTSIAACVMSTRTVHDNAGPPVASKEAVLKGRLGHQL